MRLRLSFLLLLSLEACFLFLLWDLQVVHGAGYWETARRSRVEAETVPAARGKLLDRTGAVLARDETVWTARLPERPNPDALLRLKALCREERTEWDGASPIEAVSPRLLARIRAEDISGVTFVPAVRRSDSGTLAPQVLGRVGKMDAAEWSMRKEQGYAMDALVGRDGAEAAFEDLLHGTPGRRITERDRDGRIIGVSWETLPQPGKDVTLTLDRALQQTAREALCRFLDLHPRAAGAAAVVLDVSDGGVLAMVSLPDYDPAIFPRTYPQLSSDPSAPLLNRAVQGLYAPGSVIQLVTAAAALEEGVLTPRTKILDTGRYTYYASPQPQCWLYRQQRRTHGLETVSQAITDSCNVFFYDAGRRTGIQALNRWAARLGLGTVSGIELPSERAGMPAGPETSRRLGAQWYEGSVLSAAIGQENNRFTPLQLARMTAILAGDGQCPPIHLLKDPAPPRRPTDRVPLSAGTLAAIREGMRGVTETGSLAASFRRLPAQAGAKTGSAQVAGAERSNAVLVAFAPFDNPRVALALVAEQGGSGAELGEAAAQILQKALS